MRRVVLCPTVAVLTGCGNPATRAVEDPQDAFWASLGSQAVSAPPPPWADDD